MTIDNKKQLALWLNHLRKSRKPFLVCFGSDAAAKSAWMQLGGRDSLLLSAASILAWQQAGMPALGNEHGFDGTPDEFLSLFSPQWKKEGIPAANSFLSGGLLEYVDAVWQACYCVVAAPACCMGPYLKIMNRKEILLPKNLEAVEKYKS